MKIDLQNKENTPHFNKGIKTDIAFVFSVPGQIELYNNRPAAGQTGVNLEELMFLINKRGNKIFDLDEKSKINRYKYRITNSYCIPLYKGNNQDGKSEWDKSDVLKDNNIERLKNELIDIEKYIFVFGDKAKIAIDNAKITNVKKIIYIRHLSLQSLNKIKIDVNVNPKISGSIDNTKKRLDFLAKQIVEKIEQ